MSKLIVEMEMPRNCKKCPLVGMDHFGQIRCKGQGGRLIHLKNFQTEIERPSWCPIKGVLPEEHGDLIDRDVVKKEILKRMPSWCGTSGTNGYQFCSRREMLYPISRAKAVIAAERGEYEQCEKDG